MRNNYYKLIIYYLLLFTIVSFDNFFGFRPEITFKNQTVLELYPSLILNLILFVFVLPKFFFNWTWKELTPFSTKLSLSILALIIIPTLFYISHPLISSIIINRFSLDYFLFCLLSITANAFLEEFTFRVIIFNFLRKNLKFKNSAIISILICTFLFSFAHISRGIMSESSTFIARLLFSSLFFGFLLTVIYYYTQNFFLVVILHMLVNFDVIFLIPLTYDTLYISRFATLAVIFISVILFIVHNHRIKLYIKYISGISITTTLLIAYITNFESKDIQEYHNNGKKKITLDKDSFMTIYDNKENIIAYGKYKNGRKVDNWVEYYPNGKMKWQGRYKNEE